MRTLVFILACHALLASAVAEAQAVESAAFVLPAPTLLSDFAHPFIPARTPRTTPPLKQPSPNLRRAVNLIAAGAGLTLGAVIGMTAFHDRKFRCGDSRGYTYWPGGLTASTGLLITLAGWGELNRVPREQRKLSRAQRIGLPFLLLGTALVGVAPIAGQRVVCGPD